MPLAEFRRGAEASAAANRSAAGTLGTRSELRSSRPFFINTGFYVFVVCWSLLELFCGTPVLWSRQKY